MTEKSLKVFVELKGKSSSFQVFGEYATHRRQTGVFNITIYNGNELITTLCLNSMMVLHAMVGTGAISTLETSVLWIIVNWPSSHCFHYETKS